RPRAPRPRRQARSQLTTSQLPQLSKSPPAKCHNSVTDDQMTKRPDSRDRSLGEELFHALPHARDELVPLVETDVGGFNRQADPDADLHGPDDRASPPHRVAAA